MTATEHVILVDENDNPIGTAEKLDAHRKHLCHRAFSVFVLRKNTQIEFLLQKRAKDKYHSSLLWTNTCCSHPRPGEDILDAGQRRLKEEMGLEVKLHSLGSFHYIAHFSNGLAENEIDHVLVGYSEQKDFQPDPDEVAAYKWIELTELRQQLEEHPEQFTPWLSQALQLVEEKLA